MGMLFWGERIVMFVMLCNLLWESKEVLGLTMLFFVVTNTVYFFLYIDDVVASQYTTQKAKELAIKKEKAEGNEEVDSSCASCSTGASDNGKDWKMIELRNKHEEEQATTKNEEDCGEWEKERCFLQENCRRLEEEKNSLTSQLSAANALSELYRDILHDPRYEL